MKSRELIKKYFDFFASKDHAIIPSAPLVPENDPTVLFTTAGMHPLVPYLLGETHPKGNRLVDVQLCVRTVDIDEVGDSSHHTFFEMLGNWSLGDYWKEESISWSYEFLTKDLGLEGDKLWVTCFEGDKDAPKDTESAEVWEKLGIPKSKIYFLNKVENWWGPSGLTGPCGPDTEIFYDITGKPCGKTCAPGDNCGRFFEIWNNVFMQYNKTEAGEFEPLPQKNVDTGMGVDRTTAVLSGLKDDYKVDDLWGNIISKTEDVTKTSYDKQPKPIRIIADHARASVFIAAEGVTPSNKEHGYVLRRLIRRAVRHAKQLGIESAFMGDIADVVIDVFKDDYSHVKDSKKNIIETITQEETKFMTTLSKGLREIEKIDTLDGKSAFFLYETYGFPVELTEEIAKDRGQKVDKKVFEKEFEKHKELSRTASSGKFKGGLADNSEEVTKLHTTTHLLHKALRLVLGDNVSQKGSNITSERLRFDFSHPNKLTDEEISKVEEIINDQVEKDLPVQFEVKKYEEAINEGALAFFGERYPDEVKVYTIGKGNWFSKEVCGGPHVSSTGEIGRVRIKKQEKIGADLMRVYAIVEPARDE